MAAWCTSLWACGWCETEPDCDVDELPAAEASYDDDELEASYDSEALEAN